MLGCLGGRAGTPSLKYSTQPVPPSFSHVTRCGYLTFIVARALIVVKKSAYEILPGKSSSAEIDSGRFQAPFLLP